MKKPLNILVINTDWRDTFVNCSKSGIFDKTIFKAVAYACLVLATSRDFADLAGEEFYFKENDAIELSKKLREFISTSHTCSTQFLDKIAVCIKNHNLPTLVSRLVKEM